MKWLLFICICIFFISPISAQFYQEYNLSFEKTKLNNKLDNELLVNSPYDLNDDIRFKRKLDYEWLLGFTLFNNTIKGGASLETGIHYYKCYSKYFFQQYLGLGVVINDAYAYSFEFQLNYLSIPIRIRFHSPLQLPVIFYIAVGPQLNFLRKAKTFTNIPLTYGGGTSWITPDEKYEPLGYTFKDKFQKQIWNIYSTAGIAFKLSDDNDLRINLSVNYMKSFEGIENKEFTDNQGQKVNRFIEIIEKTEGERPKTTLQSLYFKVGVSFFLVKQK